MDVKYLRAHNGKSLGETETVSEGIGKYMITLGVAEEVKVKKEMHKEEVKPKKAK